MIVYFLHGGLIGFDKRHIWLAKSQLMLLNNSILLTFCASAAATPHPHQRIYKEISFISSFQLYVESKFVGVGINAVRLSGILKLLQDILGSCSPARSLDAYEGRRFIVSLK